MSQKAMKSSKVISILASLIALMAVYWGSVENEAVGMILAILSVTVAVQALEMKGDG